MTGDCLCLNLGIECWCTRPGPGGCGYRAHGTAAAARRHYRRDGAGWRCRPCRQAEAQARADARRRETRPAVPPPDGRVIREVRLRSGMSQREFAAAAGITQQRLSSWETGRYRPAAGVLARVTAAAAEAAVAQGGGLARAA